MKQVETSSLHRGVAGARHSFLPLPGSANKLDVLLQVRLLPLRCSGSGPATLVRMVVLLAPCLLPSLLLSSASVGWFTPETLPNLPPLPQLPPMLCPPVPLPAPAGHPGGARPRQAPDDLLQHSGQLPRRCGHARRPPARPAPACPPGASHFLPALAWRLPLCLPQARHLTSVSCFSACASLSPPRSRSLPARAWAGHRLLPRGCAPRGAQGSHPGLCS